MLKIRAEQLEVFEQAAIRNFIERMSDYLQETFPKHYEIFGRDAIRNFVRYGMDQAGTNNFTSERAIRLYTTLMLMFGSRFDTDPQYAWAAEILSDASVVDEQMRIDRLYDKGIECLNYISGQNGRHLNEALGRVRGARFDDFSTSATPQAAAADFYRKVITQLASIYPQKHNYVGELGIRRMIQRGIQSANNYRITRERGVATFIGLMFFLGSGFDTDPQFAWAKDVLAGGAGGDENQKVAQLYERALGYLDRWSPRSTAGENS
jgi:hypothetical protein